MDFESIASANSAIWAYRKEKQYTAGAADGKQE